jgi:starvation-inducible DNA-binding protein
MTSSSNASVPSFTVPGMQEEDAADVVRLLQDRLHALNDLALTLKHVHWNVVGPNFIAVHEMIDPQVEAVRAMVDATAERVATLGASPQGTPGALVAARSWEDYSLRRASTQEHLGALDVVYRGVVGDHRAAMVATEELDPVTQDMLIGQLERLELFHWFVRAHLENSGGTLSTAGQEGERPAAQAAAESASPHA